MGIAYDVEQGYVRGVQRAAAEFNLSVERSKVTRTLLELNTVLEHWPFERNSVFTGLFSEIIGIAAAARHANEFPELSDAEIIGYLGHSAAILDSLKHA